MSSSVIRPSAPSLEPFTCKRPFSTISFIIMLFFIVIAPFPFGLLQLDAVQFDAVPLD
ncbi:MAG: hypothetical protein R2854_20650 [Caldilineaceae bacterium]